LLVLRELPVDPKPTPPPVKLKPPPVKLPWPVLINGLPPPDEEPPPEDEPPMEDPIEEPMEDPIEEPLELLPEDEVPWPWAILLKAPSNPSPRRKVPFFKSHDKLDIGSRPPRGSMELDRSLNP